MPPLISVGAANSDGTLRLWLAQQAVEKGEAMLAAQLASVARISASATSILGWSVTISLAMVAGISSGLVPSTALVSAATATLHYLLWPATFALLATLTASVCCVIVLWPAYWHPPAHAPDLIQSAPYGTELEVLEALAAGYVDAIKANLRRLTRLEKWLRAAWVLFVGSPVVGATVYAIQAIGIGQRIVALLG